MKKDKNLAIILARGGSRRIPNKNIKPFLGQPVVSYPIEVALKSHLFDEVMVSTDSEKIARIARRYGAKVPFMRSQETSTDKATLIEAVKEVVGEYDNKGQVFDNICYILPTAALLTPELLKKGLKLLESGNFDSVRPIQAFSYPIQRAYKYHDSELEYFMPEYSKARSQELEEMYHDAGMFYFIKRGSLDSNHKLGALVVSYLEGHDIDNLDDWKVAELKYMIRNHK